MIKTYFIMAIFLNLSAAFAGGIDKVGNGADRIEALFIKAQIDVSFILNSIQMEKIDSLKISESSKNWLKTQNNLSLLQFFEQKMTLFFQDPPCNEGGMPRSTSFDNSNPDKPVVCVSISYNQMTTIEQAEALIIHEAGHFVGEQNHTFLSALGVELANEKQSRGSVFNAKSPMGYNKDCGTVTVLSKWHVNKLKETAKEATTNLCRLAGWTNCVLESIGIRDFPTGCFGYARIRGE